MRARILSLSALLLCSLTLFYCKKDQDPPAPQPERPFFNFLKDAGIKIDTVAAAADTWEYGFVFHPMKSGAITDLGLKLPATGDFVVTLWDLSGPNPVMLKQKTIFSGEKHLEFYNDFPPIAVTKGNKYGVSILANAFYRISKPGNLPFVFPRVIGNLVVESFNEAVNNTSLATFPATTNDTRVAPCVDVIFIAD